VEVLVKYLYGDSTPSPLESNFLAFLGDAMELCIHLIDAEDRIEALRRERRALDEYVESERVRISGLRALVTEAADAANTDGEESLSHRAVSRVRTASEQAISTTLRELESKLDADRAALAARDRHERDSCLGALGRWIAHHKTHEGTWSLSAHLQESGTYKAETAGTAPFGLGWECTIEPTAGNAMAAGVRVADFGTHIEMSIPEVSGWLKKGTKFRPQRIDHYSIDAFSTDGNTSTMALRATPRTPIGVDVEIRGDAVTVTLAGAKEKLTVDVDADDVPRFLTLRDRILDALTSADGVRRQVLTATFDKAPLADHQDFVAVAKRIIEAAAPIVREIQIHSPTPKELVLRRPLGSDGARRSWEEIFVPTKSLLDKVGRLSRTLRPVFAPLGLEVQRAQTPLPFAAIEVPDVVEVRMVAEEPAPDAAPVRVPAFEPPSQEPAAGEVVRERPSEPPAATSMASIVIDASYADAAPPSNGGPQPAISIDASSKEALAATVKRIVKSAREGRTHEAYAAYAALFEDSGFAQQRPQDQRQVLKLMVLSKSPPPPSDQVRQAYDNARARLLSLGAGSEDPIDRELLAKCADMLAGQSQGASGP
jgi:hypothetical protein